MNMLDRALRYVAPRLAMRRHLTRMTYDGAVRSHRTSGRRISNTSAKTEIAGQLSRLRDVHRDLVRNNPLAARAVSAIPSNVVGSGIELAIVSDRKRVKNDLKRLVSQHLDTAAIDHDGRLTLYGIQSLIMRTVVESGEALVIRETPPSTLRLPVPLQVRVLEPDYLDDGKHGVVPGGGHIFNGIEFDASGRRVAYWLYDYHPGGDINYATPSSRRVPAADVIHVYRMDRPGQVRGVPWGAPVIVTMWDMAEYKDAELMRQKIAACFAVFWTGADAPNLGANIAQNEFSRGGAPLETVEPGMIQRLPLGADVKFASPPTVAGYADFLRVAARDIAAGYGVPYEIVTGDMSQVSFISGRLGQLQFQRDIEQWRWGMLIPQACEVIGRWFLDASSIVLGQPLQDVRLDWTPPRREMVDPKSEIPAMVAAIRGGLSSRSEELRKLGYEPEAIDQEIAEDNARADALGNRYDSDGRYAKNGGPAAGPANGDVSDEEPAD